LRAASLAVIPPVLLVVSTGCQDESEATGPLGGRQIQVAQANRGAMRDLHQNHAPFQLWPETPNPDTL
jgi:hypothetical protein